MRKLLSGILTGLAHSLLAAALLLTLPAAARAQALGGSLLGTVFDETGAALPGATVTLTQMETNLSRDLVTNESGAFTATNLLPGTYQVVVQLQGFQTFTTKDIADVVEFAVDAPRHVNLGLIEVLPTFQVPGGLEFVERTN